MVKDETIPKWYVDLNARLSVCSCKGKGIQLEAYSPLLSGHLKDVKGIDSIAQKHGKTHAQVILRWDLQNGIIVIPKSTHESRIMENAGLFDFELTNEEMAAIDSLNRNRRFLRDPEFVTW